MANERFGEFIEQSPSIWLQGLYEESSTQKYPLGTVRPTLDGRIFIYTKNGAAGLAAGKMTQLPVQEANHLNCAVPITALGAREVTVTLGATAVVKDFYKDGYLYINDATGAGFSYKIKGHAAHAGGGALVVSLYDKIRKALDATSKATLVVAPGGNVIITAAPPTAPPMGIPPIDVTAAYYFWNQVKGPAVCLISGAIAVNSNIKPGGAAGAVAIAAEAEILYDAIGYMINTGVDTKYKMIMLDIPGY